MKARKSPAGEGSPWKLWAGFSGREVFPMCEPLWMFPRRERALSTQIWPRDSGWCKGWPWKQLADRTDEEIDGN